VAKKKEERGKKGEKKDAPDKEFRYIVRIADTDLDGERPVPLALTQIKGVGIRVALALTDVLGLDRRKKIGELSEKETDRIQKALENLPGHLPMWMLNRRKEMFTGKNVHYYSTELGMKIRDDINLMKKIRCYRGIRHETGQKVRGQRTRSNGRSGMTVGVIRRKGAKSGRG